MIKNFYSLPEADLNHVLNHTAGLWEETRGARFFVTGGTGFWGRWLVESFLWANDRLDLKARMTVLTRDVEGFRKRSGGLADHPALKMMGGDVRSFPFMEGAYPYVIHAATDSRASLNEKAPLLMLDTIVSGTKRTLDFAAEAHCRKFLLASSGAVHGRQPPQVELIAEDNPGAPDGMDARSAYGEGKRVAELWTLLQGQKHGFECKIARGYAFAGPYLPLDAHYAIGNFLRDAMAGRAIEIKGDGTPCRSYLDAADMAAWLWTILFKGQNGRPYHVGSEEAKSIRELAELVNTVCGTGCAVEVKGTPQIGVLPERYVPCTARARTELGLEQRIALPDSLRKWKSWLEKHEPHS
jgi:nucleoside-diphosphate-sugar epimerase